MNLYLRLFWLLIRLPFMKKVSDPLAKTTLTMRVLPNDLDFNMHMNNGRYLTIMDLGRFHLTYLNGILMPCLKRKWLPVLGSAKIHFIKPLNIFDQYQLDSRVIYWDHKWIYLEQNFYKKDQLCATALLKALFVGKDGKIHTDDILALLKVPVEKPAIPEPLARWILAEKKEELEEAGSG